MAKKPTKAPGPGSEAGEAAPKSRKKLLAVAALVLVAAGGGGGAYVLKKRAASAEAEHAEKADEKRPVAFLDLREMMLNLNPEGADKARFAKLRIVLELKDAKVEGEVKPLMPRVEDAVQVYMRELRASDLSGSLALYRLREELLRRVNHAVHPAHVEAVLFKDLIVQ